MLRGLRGGRYYSFSPLRLESPVVVSAAAQQQLTLPMAAARKPVLAIVGATGTGKSQLAVDLALRFHGEIINADAMQMYAGLPVITNKVTPEERRGVEHHLLGCVDVGSDEAWRVDTFVPRAAQIIEQVHGRGKLPIVVGGTHYYVQKLLFAEGLAGTSPSALGAEAGTNAGEWPILDEPTDVILAKLREVDPAMAERWHPRERRKIRRSLQIWLDTGRRASEVYAEQAANPRRNQLRWPATLVLWTHSEWRTLEAQLGSRVDKMLEGGLLEEVGSLEAERRAMEQRGQAVDETTGIWVSIGYKEFKQYSAAAAAAAATDAAAADAGAGAPSTTELGSLRAASVERTKISTRQYAKSQLKWIRVKLINALRDANALDQLFLIDTTHPLRWEEAVLGSAVELTRKHLDGEELPAPTELSPLAAEMLTPKQGYDLSTRPEMWRSERCELCGVTATTAKSWAAHLSSKRHKALSNRQALVSADTIKAP